MNIILDKSLKTDSKQPKVFNLGQITTTLQDLLDNSTIVINGEQTIILSIIDENDNVLKYLLPLDYKGESFYGLGKNILEEDLISLGSLETKPYKVYTALLTQTGTNAPTAIVLENTLGNIVWSREGVGGYTGVLTTAFTENKTAIFYALNNDANFDYNMQMYRESDSTIYIFTGVGLDMSDSILNISTPIEIRIYD